MSPHVPGMGRLLREGSCVTQGLTSSAVSEGEGQGWRVLVTGHEILTSVAADLETSMTSDPGPSITVKW